MRQKRAGSRLLHFFIPLFSTKLAVTASIDISSFMEHSAVSLVVDPAAGYSESSISSL